MVTQLKIDVNTGVGEMILDAREGRESAVYSVLNSGF
jgi:hypothetical protein